MGVRSSLEKKILALRLGQSSRTLSSEEETFLAMDLTSWITITMELPVAPLPLTQISMTPVNGLSVLFQSTFGGEVHAYQVAHVPEEVTPSIEEDALQQHSVGTTSLPTVSSEHGNDSISWEIVATPSRDQLLLNNVIGMFDVTCLNRVGQISSFQAYRANLAIIVVSGSTQPPNLCTS